jgi:hypothetical protein
VINFEATGPEFIATVTIHLDATPADLSADARMTDSVPQGIGAFSDLSAAPDRWRRALFDPGVARSLWFAAQSNYL